jgi:hypothetical protein
MKRVSRAHRTPIETVRAIVEFIGAHPHSLDTEAAGVIGGQGANWSNNPSEPYERPMTAFGGLIDHSISGRNTSALT